MSGFSAKALDGSAVPGRQARQIAYRRPWMYEKQERAIFDEHRYSFIEGTTKSGKTLGNCYWLIEQALLTGKEGRNYWWVAPVFGTAKIAFRKCKQLLPKSLYVKNEAEMSITLANGATLWFKSGDTPDSLYGEEVYAVVIDEASRMKEESWHAVRTTVTTTRGKVRAIGNVKGRKNWFFHLCRRAEGDAGSGAMAYHKLTADDAIAGGVMDQDEVNDARSVLPDAVFRQLYYAEPADDGGNPFGLDAIKRCVLAELSKKPLKCWGWDLAKSTDWTAGVALDGAGHMCRPLVRFQKPWRLTKSEIVRIAGNKPSLVDSTGVGDPILEDLRAQPGTAFEGFKFSAPSKHQLMEGLAVALQSGNVGLTDQTLINELDSFEYEYTAAGVRYSAPEGMHDDCVMALALAVKKLGPIGRGDFAFETGKGSGGESAGDDEQRRPSDPWEHSGRGWEGRDYNLV